MISTLALSRVSALSIADNQKQLVEAQTEQSTGRLANIGLALGSKTSLDLDIRLATDRNTLEIEQNQLASNELSATQTGMSALVELAQNFSATLIGARNAPNGQKVIKEAALNTLSRLQEILNSTHDGKALFSGINTDTPPLADYLSVSPPNSKIAVDAAFVSQFGFSQYNAAVANITPFQMDTFLNGSFESQFDQANWISNWSSANAQNRTIRIGDDLTAQVSVNANDVAFRNLTKAVTMALDLGSGSLNQATFEIIIDKSISITNSAAGEIGNIASVLGITQKQLVDQNAQLTHRNDILNKQIAQLEGVDPYEIATKVNGLVTQLEASYAITGRLSKLSLLNYI
jgi:flagellar hook-associated protein 3 FlgL